MTPRRRAYDARRTRRPRHVRGLPQAVGAACDNGSVTTVTKPRIPNVLAARYASAELVTIWSPEEKVRAERRLWIAVLRAQRDLGIALPDGVIEAYEAVVDEVDLASIAARERVTRHDVKARIEEFSALAGHEHIHKGMTSRDLTENVEQLQIRASLELIRDRMVAALARLAELAVEYDATVMVGRSHNVPAQATTLGKRFASAAEELLLAYERIDDLLERYPLRGIKGPVGTSADQLDLLDGDAAKVAELERRVAAHLGFARVLHQRRPGLPALARLRRRLGAGPGGRRPVVAGHHDPADGRPGAGHRGLQGRPGRLVRDAAQDEHALVRAGQRPRRDRPRLPVDGRRAGRRPVERGRRVVLGRPPGRAAGRVLRRSTGCSRRSSRCSTSSAPTRP